MQMQANIKLTTFLLMLFICLAKTFSLNAQGHFEPYHVLKSKSKDSTSLNDTMLKSQVEMHSRSFLMKTLNQGIQNDSYAMATGVGIGMRTKAFKGFRVGVSGFFINHISSSDNVLAFPSSGIANRYESGLFDLEHPENKNNMNRLEELYLKYSYSKSAILLGKFNLNTPFFNPQDGRMRPTLEEGIWLIIKESERIGFNGGWIWAISPRSTFRWHHIANSIGIYPSGVNVNGDRAEYAGQIVGSSGIAVANVYFRPSKHWKLEVWNGFLENVMNTVLIETKYELKKNGNRKYLGLIYLHQSAIRNGGNADPVKTYMEKNGQSNVISAQIGLQKNKWNTTLNYTHITGDGRYLMPREWGREVFYTFLNRERNEGLGNVHALMLKIIFTSKNERFNSTLAYGYYHLPDVFDYRLNKYGLPSYHQINYAFNFSFRNFLKGLDVKFLAAYKINAGNTYSNPKFIFNKVNMVNLNFVIDFKI